VPRWRRRVFESGCGRALTSRPCRSAPGVNSSQDESTGEQMTHSPPATVNARISPRGGLDVLSRDEIARLRDASGGGLHELLRRCALAVLTTDTSSDDPRAAAARY